MRVLLISFDIWLAIILKMFFIRNKAITQAVRSSRNLFKNEEKKTQPTPKAQKTSNNTGFVMATEDLSKPYPYKFGGIKPTKKSQPRLQSLLPSRIPQFFKIYLQFLSAVQNKNQKALSSLAEPDLIQPLLARNVQLMDPSSSCRIQYNHFGTGLGVKAKRDPKIKFDPMPLPKKVQLTQNIKVYMAQDPRIAFQQMQSPNSKGFPILLSAQITITSKARLISKGSVEKEQEQSHLLTFERESSLNISQALSILSPAKISSGFLDPQNMKNLLYTEQNPWKIANIDSFFKNKWQ